MITIYKYPLEVKDEQEIDIHMVDNGGTLFRLSQQVLSVDAQNDIPCLWAIVDTDMPKRNRKIIIRGTGHDCSDIRHDVDYLGSFQLYSGAFVGHVFGR